MKLFEKKMGINKWSDELERRVAASWCDLIRYSFDIQWGETDCML